MKVEYMRNTINAEFMAAERKYAEGFPGVGGMMNVVDVTLLPHIQVYRFATDNTPADRLYGNSWWFGYSSYQALLQIAGGAGGALRAAARECLAVPPEWNNAMDLLVCAHVLQPLSAWSGRPRTARSKDTRTQEYGAAWKPDRSITQLYVPGLSPRRSDGTMGRAIPWPSVLRPGIRTPIPPS
jgi:hypothetical protein